MISTFKCVLSELQMKRICWEYVSWIYFFTLIPDGAAINCRSNAAGQENEGQIVIFILDASAAAPCMPPVQAHDESGCTSPIIFTFLLIGLDKLFLQSCSFQFCQYVFDLHATYQQEVSWIQVRVHRVIFIGKKLLIFELLLKALSLLTSSRLDLCAMILRVMFGSVRWDNKRHWSFSYGAQMVFALGAADQKVSSSSQIILLVLFYQSCQYVFALPATFQPEVS